MMNKDEEIKELAKVICQAIILNKGQNSFSNCMECFFGNGDNVCIGCSWLAKELIDVGFRKEEYVRKQTAEVLLGAYYKTANLNPDKKITLSLEGIKDMGHEVYGIEVDK